MPAGQILEISDNGANDYVQTEDGEVPNHEQIQRSRLRVDSRKWPQEVRRQGIGSVIRPRQTLCQASAIWSSKSGPFTRCKSHGGMSTGPEAAEGIECIRQAVTKHGTPDRPKARQLVSGNPTIVARDHGHQGAQRLLYFRQIYACHAQIRSGFLLRRAGLGIFGVAGLSFGIGGAISEFGQTDRFLFEFEGIGLAVVCGGIGFIAKEAGERLAECDEQAELGDGGIQTLFGASGEKRSHSD